MSPNPTYKALGLYYFEKKSAEEAAHFEEFYARNNSSLDISLPNMA